MLTRNSVSDRQHQVLEQNHLKQLHTYMTRLRKVYLGAGHYISNLALLRKAIGGYVF